MDEKTARALAKELMDIQLGSAEDAKNLLDSTFTSAERTMIENEIDHLATLEEVD